MNRTFKVDIIEARETRQTVTEQKFQQSGLTLAITAPVVTALQSVASTVQAVGQTQDGRMQALGIASAAMNAKTAVEGLQAASAAMEAGKGVGEAANVGISITVGGSKSQSSTTQGSDSARGSSVGAGGNVNITASGAGQDSGLWGQVFHYHMPLKDLTPSASLSCLPGCKPPPPFPTLK